MPCRVTETDVRAAKDDGSDPVRAAAIVSAGVDYDSNVTVLLADGDAAVVTVAGHRAHRDEHWPGDFHRR
jgi:hypothetical protein